MFNKTLQNNQNSNFNFVKRFENPKIFKNNLLGRKRKKTGTHGNELNIDLIAIQNFVPILKQKNYTGF